MSSEDIGAAASGPATQMVQLVFPDKTNHYNTLFGGVAISWMDQAAYIAAHRWCRKKVVTAHMSAVDFKYPIAVGAIVELVARVVATGRTSMTVSVDVWLEPFESDDRILAVEGTFIMIALDENDKPVPVPSLDEYLRSK